ncbi:ceramidase domain-containing protein [Streptomyces sp. ISL-100]|uniref:ceramidase domain-containing protein n=1 Tax=Streptomyces sp. ISL-100 TaxID=2819173 RepID=UPI001BE8DF32|nr:ceramidase domain-containing protein [Streptomyces sp. ISL-100]MBT2401571.1 ceramidase domain-containing protein [Streptomyces sp. ISL-100]
MNWHEHVDHYCERVTEAFWAEPANAVSNLSFVVAAWAIWRMARMQGRLPLRVGFMAPLMVLIGIGSFAFHTLATPWAQVLDIVPIGLFVLCYLAAYLREFYRLAWQWCLLGVAAFAGFTAAFIVFAGDYIPNRSGTYVPVLLLMLGLAVTMRASRNEGRAQHWVTFGAATGVFAAALTARTVDHSVCGSFPLGTHFLWHTLDGVLVFLVGRALVLHWQSERETAASSEAEARAVKEGV